MPQTYTIDGNYAQCARYREVCRPINIANRKARKAKLVAFAKAMLAAEPYRSPQADGERAIKRGKQLAKIAANKQKARDRRALKKITVH